jgi:hypothetical protein
VPNGLSGLCKIFRQSFAYPPLTPLDVPCKQAVLISASGCAGQLFQRHGRAAVYQFCRIVSLQPRVNTIGANSTHHGIGGLNMSNGGRRNNKVESLSIDAPKRSWATIMFDLLYPSIVAVIVINLAVFIGYIEQGQFNDLFPPVVTNLFGRFL